MLALQQGPQFKSKFEDFCKRYGVKHEVSLPYNLHSNGLVEVNVRIFKNLILKTNPTTFDEAFSESKNTDRPNKLAPNALFFKCDLHLNLPILNTTQPLTSTPDPKKRYHTLRHLPVRMRIRMQDSSRCWSLKGHIVAINDIKRMYNLLLDDQQKFRRNRRFIKKCYS